MNLVEAIKSPKQVNEMKQYLKEKDTQYYTMFVLGINVALRISDLLSLKWKDVLQEDKKNFRDIKIREGKTKKLRTIKLNESSKNVLIECMNSLNEINLNEFIFVTREKNNKHVTEAKFLSILNSILTLQKIGLEKVDSCSIKELKHSIKLDKVTEKIKTKNPVYYPIFMLVLHSDMMLSDVLKMTAGEVRKLKDDLFQLVDKEIKGVKDSEYAFKEVKGSTKPITRQTALEVLKSAARAVGITEEVGTHSLRKIWGWNQWKSGISPILIMKALNHSNLEVTERYLGITQSNIDDLYTSINL